MSDASLLTELYRDKSATLVRHQAHARIVTQYDANNTYQYVINRDDAHLAWIAQALSALNEAVPAAETPATTEGNSASRTDDGVRTAVEDDVRQAQSFVERWRARVDQFTDDRYERVLGVILGETLEEKRFFEQAAAGRLDLLGKRSPAAAPAKGEVLPTRWIE